MYCRKCGFELPADGKFCPRCGCEAEDTAAQMTKPKMNKPSKRRKPMAFAAASVIIVAALAAAILLGTHFYKEGKYNDLISNAVQYLENDELESAIACWEKAIKLRPDDSEVIRGEMEYYKAIINAEEAGNISDWGSVIENLEKAIALKPDIADNYLTLATAYVEEWELYHASETLRKGYDATQDVSLKHVSIWGPLSPVEIALYVTENMPVTRCEYVFTEKGINSYIYVAGIPRIGANYICEDEQVRYVSVLDYSYSGLSGVFPQQVPAFPIGRVLVCYDLAYDDEGRVSAVTYDDQVFVTLEYAGGNCTAIIAQADYGSIFYIGDYMNFTYDSQDRITQINYECQYAGQTIAYSYDDISGGFAASPSQYEGLFRFDENGVLIGFSEPTGYDDFSVITDNGQIIFIENNDFYYRLNYSDGKLSEIIESAKGQAAYISYKYDYEPMNGIEYLIKITQCNGNEEIVRMTLSYDEHGNILSIDGKNETITFTYLEDGTLYTFSTVSDSVRTYILEYDEVGRVIGWNEVTSSW